MKKAIGTDQLSEAIKLQLIAYNQNVITGIKKEAKSSMSQLVKQTKATAPVGTRDVHYRDNIKSKKLFEAARAIEYVWYVDGPDYRLSHLLENGHALRNGERTVGTHFIKKASDPILEEYAKIVEEIVKNG